MVFYGHFIYTIFTVTLFCGCAVNEKKSQSPNNSRYDLLNPYVIKLPAGLAEISGIAYYPKDTAVFAIEDEAGTLYKIYLTKKNVMYQEAGYIEPVKFETILRGIVAEHSK